MKQIFIVLVLVAGFAFGKSAEDYLHDASYKYIAGRHQEAALAVEEGLRENPGDPRLHLLDDLLKQMKDQQRKDQNQSGGGDSKDKQDKKDQQNKQDQKDQQNKDPQNKNGNGSKDQKDKQDQNKQDQNPQPKDSSGQDKDKKQQPPQPKPGENKGDSLGKGGGEPPRMPGQMSKEEAERLLNSFVDDEKKAQQNRQGTPRKRNGDQDW